MESMLKIVAITGLLLAVSGVTLLRFPYLVGFCRNNSAFIMALPPILVASYIFVFTMASNQHSMSPSGKTGSINLMQLLMASFMVTVAFFVFSGLISVLSDNFRLK